MVMEIGDGAIARRTLMLRDAASLLIVLLTTIALFGLTLFLFRSFTAHRAELARRWSERGRLALRGGRASEAIVDLRTALSYAPGTRDYELLLAEALGQAGTHLHNPALVNESFNYYLGLWESTPGDGNINLALARLAASKGDRDNAVHYYRAAIYGTWEQGDGVQRRAAIRAELARYFIEQKDFQNARTELLIAAGNTMDTYERDMNLAHLLQEAADPRDAKRFYEKSLALRPDDPVALEEAGRLAYSMADYESAHKLLQRAAEQHAAGSAEDMELAHVAAQILDLDPSRAASPRERAFRVRDIREIARRRFEQCIKDQSAQLPTAQSQAIASRWAAPEAAATVAGLIRDPARMAAALELAYETERQLQTSCGNMGAADALVLHLATASSSKGGDAQ